MERFDRPLTLHTLPSSLVHLVLVSFNHPLAPGILPPTLQRISFHTYNQRLMLDGVRVLPEGLRALQLILFNIRTDDGSFPDGVTHLSLEHFNEPIVQNFLPPALISLHLGIQYRQPLLPRILPPTLRVFSHSEITPHALLPGVLPHGLVALQWAPLMNVRVHLLADALPQTLRVLDLGHRWRGEIAPGAIPASVRWLGLRRRLQKWAEQHVPAGVHVEWK